MLRDPRYSTEAGVCCRAGKRKNGAGLAPSASLIALKPFSISSLTCASLSFLLPRWACDQVWEPTVWPAAGASLRISGGAGECLPIGKNTALVHSSASVFRTEGVVGHGPSSNVSTTSLSVRKSSCLNCWNPKPGPPVVSTTTTRLTPSASGLAQVLLAGAGAGAAGLAESAAVTSTSCVGLAAATGSGSAFRGR